jgi:hypothetical protein
VSHTTIDIIADASDALDTYVHQFMLRAEFGFATSESMIRANPVDNPFPHCNDYVECWEPRKLNRKRLTDHVSGHHSHFAVHTSYKHKRQWLDVIGILSVGDAVGLAAHPGGQSLIDAAPDGLEGRRPPIGFTTARDLLDAEPGSKAYEHGMKAVEGKTGYVADLKRALLVTPSGSPAYWCARRAIDFNVYTAFETRAVTPIAIDIDGKDGFPKHVTLQAAIELAHAIGYDLVGDATAFVEPSRNRGGAYLWSLIEWETDDPAERNRILRALERWLIDKYPQDEYCGIDKVGGKLCWHEENANFDHRAYWGPPWPHADDSEHLPTAGELYESDKRGHGFRGKPDGFTVRPEFERIRRVNGGDLITMPLHNLPADPDGGEKRLREYQSWMSAPNRTISQGRLMRIIGYDPAKAAPGQPMSQNTMATSDRPAERQIVTASPNATLVAAMEAADVPLPRPDTEACEALIDDTLPCVVRRSRLAAFALRAAMGNRERAIEWTLRLWELPGGPTTRPTRHRAREQKAAKAVDQWLHGTDRTEPFDPELCVLSGDAELVGAGGHACSADRPWFADADICEQQEMLTRRLPKCQVQKINDRHKGSCLDHHLLAVALCAWIKNIVTVGRHKTGREGRRGEVPTKAIRRILESYGCPKRLSGATVAAAGEALVDLGMIVMTQNFSAGTHARRWAIGRNFSRQAWVEDFIEAGDWATTPPDTSPPPAAIPQAAPAPVEDRTQRTIPCAVASGRQYTDRKSMGYAPCLEWDGVAVETGTERSFTLGLRAPPHTLVTNN